MHLHYLSSRSLFYLQQERKTCRRKTYSMCATCRVQPVVQENVEIYGDYVGRIRAQLFVEVRARVEGFLERMHFEEGSYVKKDQVLFVINQDQYRAKADKARAQLKKDRTLPASWIWTMPLQRTKRQRLV